ncbi:uncharacterized protein [Lolium perenne]|uniref:uncharacterized protein n=1 Tax=Lolium perenne TaxID=4522 RepID=UPI003A998B8D
MGEPKGLAEAREQLTLFLSKGGGSEAIVPRQEVVQKIDLSPTDIKLEGVTNYLSWSRRAMLAVDQKDLDGYLLGTIKEPGDKTSAEGKKWKTINSLLIGWLLNSVVPSIGRSVEGLSTAAEIWKTLSIQYSGKGNVMLIAQIDGKIRHLHQGDMTVMAYVAELQALWADQDNCDPLELYDAASIESGHKWIARRRVLKFLEGLSKCFDGRKASLLHHTSLPTLDEAIAAMAQEEVRLSLEPADEKVVSAPTFAVTERREWKETRDCFICGETGHLKWYCPTRGRGRGYNRGGSSGMARGRGGHAGNSGGQSAHMAT